MTITAEASKLRYCPLCHKEIGIFYVCDINNMVYDVKPCTFKQYEQCRFNKGSSSLNSGVQSQP